MRVLNVVTGEDVKVILANGKEMSGQIKKVEEGYFFVKVRVLTVDTLEVGEVVEFSVKNLYEITGEIVDVTEEDITLKTESGVKCKFSKSDIYKVTLV